MGCKGLLIVWACLIALGPAFAQSEEGEALTARAATPTPYKAQKMTLSSVTSIGITVRTATGQALTAPRHEIIATLDNPPACPSGAECPALPAGNIVTLLFDEGVFSTKASYYRQLLFCRRAIESVEPTEKVLLEGNIRLARNTGLVYVDSLTSCSIEAAAG